MGYKGVVTRTLRTLSMEGVEQGQAQVVTAATGDPMDLGHKQGRSSTHLKHPQESQCREGQFRERTGGEGASQTGV
jgi:hypothetical protein